MKRLIGPIAIAVIWMFLWDAFNIPTLLVGLGMAALLVAIFGRGFGTVGKLPRIGRFIAFLGYFIRILVIANWQVAKLVLSPGMPIHPRIIRYDVSALSPAQLTTLASAITLTPGTLSTDLSPDRRFLYVHCLNAADRDRAILDIDDLRDRLLRGLFS